jgi:hypothetical protein
MRIAQPARAAASLAVLMLLAACASQQPTKDQGQQGAATSSPSTSQTTAAPESRGSTQQRPVAGAQVNDPKSALFQRSVFYDYDQSNIKTDFRSTVEAPAPT